jgi:hypothetical protein
VSLDPPPGFVRLHADERASVLVWADARFESSLRALGLVSGPAAHDWIADPRRAPGAVDRRLGAGRAPAAVIALPERSELVHLRALRHGGPGAALWGSRLWGPGRGGHELRAAARLRDRGAPVPRPVLLAARRARPGWQVATGRVFVDDAEDARSWLVRAPDQRTVVRAARAAGRGVRRFHDCGGRHGDLHLGNLLLRPARTGSFEVWVIDLDGARVGDPPSPARRMRELMRLFRSVRKHGLVDRLGPRGLAAFFAAYCDGDRGLRRALRRRLRLERARIALHAVRYR